jgi:asparagine N-glycosylation enzyme membrane subunit Stt3
MSAPLSRALIDAIVVIALVALAVVLRLAPYPVVFGEGGVVMRHVDAHYHLHLAQQWAAGIPPSWVDPHIAWPEGGERVWPLGFTALLALPSLWGAASLVPVWAAVAPVVLGVLSMLLAMALAMRWSGRGAALFVGTYVALARGAVDVTSLGDADHHAIVGPITLGALLALVVAIDAIAPRRAIVLGTMAGALSAAGTLLWPISAPIFHAILCAILGLLLLGRQRAPQLAAASVAFGVGSAAAAVAIAASCSTDLAPFASYAPSWFFAMPFVAAAVVLVAMAAMSRRMIAVTVVGAVVAGVAAVVAVPAIQVGLIDVLSVAGGKSAMYDMAREADRLFAPRGVFSVSQAFLVYSPLVLVVPLALLLAGRRAASASQPATDAVAVLVAGSAALALALLQVRFREYSVCLLPVVLAWGHHVYVSEREVDSRKAANAVLSAVAALALGMMGVSVVRAAEASAVDSSQRDLVEWIEQIDEVIAATPTPANGLHAVVAQWELSNIFALKTERFVTTASFGAPRVTVADARTARILLTQDAAERERLLDEAEARWVVVGGLPSVETLAALAQIDAPAFEVVERAEQGWVRETFAKPEFWQTLLGRLLVADGAAVPLGRDGVVADVGLWRLAWESPAVVNAFGHEVPALRLFERAVGTHFEGQAAPGSEVVVTVEVESNQHRRFVWQGRTTADRAGRFVVRVPYSEGCVGGITAGAPTLGAPPRQ